MIKAICLDLPILEISNVARYQFWYDYSKQ